MGVIFREQLNDRIIEPALFTNLANSQFYGSRVADGVQITYVLATEFNWLVFYFMAEIAFTPENQDDITTVLDIYDENQSTVKLALNLIKSTTNTVTNPIIKTMNDLQGRTLNQ